jgi:hypothetical protein
MDCVAKVFLYHVGPEAGAVPPDHGFRLTVNAESVVGTIRVSQTHNSRSALLRVGPLGDLRLSTLIWRRRTKISTSRRVLDWISPISAPQSNLSSWTIRHQHHPIRSGSPAVFGSDNSSSRRTRWLVVPEPQHGLIGGSGRDGAGGVAVLVAQLCGQRYERRDGRAAYRWGMTMSEIDYHGGKAAVRRPRVREHRGAELELASWQAIKGADLLSRWAFNQMLIGVATRKYARSVRLPEAIWQVVGRW